MLFGLLAGTTVAFALGGRFTLDERLQLLAIIWAMFLPMGVTTYASMAARGAVWEDGFTASTNSTSMRVVTYMRRGLRAKVRWDEVQRVLYHVDEAGAPLSVTLFLSPRDKLSLRVRAPEKVTQATVSLIAFERWCVLGGAVERVGENDQTLTELEEAADFPPGGREGKGPPSWAADRAGWARYEEVVGPARAAFAQALMDGQEAATAEVKAALEGKKGISERLDAFYKIEAQSERAAAAVLREPFRAWEGAVRRGTEAYDAEVARTGRPAGGSQPAWLPTGKLAADSGGILRAADEWPQNRLTTFGMFAGLGAVCVPLGVWMMVGGQERAGLLLLLLGALGVGTTVWECRLGADKFRFWLLVPRFGDRTRGRRVVQPDQRGFFNPVTELAVPVYIHEEFVKLDFGAAARGGEPMGLIGLLKFSYLEDLDARNAAAEMLLADPKPDVKRWLTGVVEGEAKEWMARLPAEKFAGEGGKLDLGELRNRVNTVVRKRGMRLDDTGALFAAPAAFVEEARREAERTRVLKKAAEATGELPPVGPARGGP
jgi:hypothetical protein